MSKATYTTNQTGAIAFLSAGMMWGLAAYGIARIFGFAHPLFLPMIIIVYLLLLPFYTKRINPAFLIGMIFGIFSIIIFAIYPSLVGAPPWNELSRSYFSYVLLYLVSIAFIYFSFKSYNETSAKATYTVNQTGTIATLFGIVLWALTSSWIASLFGGYQGLILPTMTIVYLILLPFILKPIKLAFIVGMVIGIITMIWTAIYPSLTGAPSWYAFTAPVYQFSFVIYYLFTVAFIYFAYRSHAELDFSIIQLVKDLAA